MFAVVNGSRLRRRYEAVPLTPSVLRKGGCDPGAEMWNKSLRTVKPRERPPPYLRTFRPPSTHAPGLRPSRQKGKRWFPSGHAFGAHRCAEAG